ncbi:MAG: TlpA disulfide reductase family protein [Methylotenera sp.]|jgi:thiol-disulfide isomerase/thioredoxin|uniref:TlpA family protein disulfide reductase n=1 Tax=Methylotenera sp. TaxID=2051956 RepID=UPI00272053C0|nr:TlpA disulfide reductase family protein [Methylotenera sp.]MDO9151273.1 TlpA disulfide reductase family protein [Methylotenera sp.]
MLNKIIKPLFFIALVLTVALVSRHFSSPSNENELSSTPLYTANLPDVSGKTQNLGQYKGKIIIVNFWATWCPPCKEEMPELIALQQSFKDKNVIVLGIAIDEPLLVAEYLKTAPVNYPIVASETEGSLLGEQLGNDKGVLPYTVIINADGKVVNTHFGRINKTILEAAIKPLISP